MKVTATIQVELDVDTDSIEEAEADARRWIEFALPSEELFTDYTSDHDTLVLGTGEWIILHTGSRTKL